MSETLRVTAPSALTDEELARCLAVFSRLDRVCNRPGMPHAAVGDVMEAGAALIAEVRRSHDEVRALRADAKRLDWLQQTLRDVQPAYTAIGDVTLSGSFVGVSVEVGTAGSGGDLYPTKDTLRDALDAAMALGAEGAKAPKGHGG